VTHPRPPPLEPVVLRPRPLRFYERPWLWAGIVSGGALIVGLAVGLAPHNTNYQVSVDGTRFSH
jgi:hypothetical protein